MQKVVYRKYQFMYMYETTTYDMTVKYIILQFYYFTRTISNILNLSSCMLLNVNYKMINLKIFLNRFQ